MLALKVEATGEWPVGALRSGSEPENVLIYKRLRFKFKMGLQSRLKFEGVLIFISEYLILLNFNYIFSTFVTLWYY